MKSEVIPESLKVEGRIGVWSGILLCTALFLMICLPWCTDSRELFRQEGFFAAVASEWHLNFTTSAHGVVRDDVWPLFPAMVSLLTRIGMPMESALRVLSALMTGGLALLAGCASGARRNYRAGLVSAAFVIGTMLAMERGGFGSPDTMGALFLLAAQLVFFHFGSRHADWNRAWIFTALLLSLGFLASGPIIFCYFIFPIFFFRRPLSFAGKFRQYGFVIAVVFCAMVILGWVIPTGLALRESQSPVRFSDFATLKYLKELVIVPFFLLFRLLPWSLIVWFPFCAALRSIDPTPVYSRYLRTLFFSMLGLFTLLPYHPTGRLLFLLGPLAILTGLYYDHGVRRYGGEVRRILSLGEIFFWGAVAAIALVQLLPASMIAFFSDAERWSFRGTLLYRIAACGAVLLLAVELLIYRRGRSRRNLPVWFMLLLLSFGFGIVYNTLSLPYAASSRIWRNFGNDIQQALAQEKEPPKRLYKYEIEGMFCGLFYTGRQIVKLHSLNDIPEAEETIYLISPRLPALPQRVWTPLLPDDYNCAGHRLSLWRGVRILELAESSNEQ